MPKCTKQEAIAECISIATHERTDKASLWLIGPGQYLASSYREGDEGLSMFLAFVHIDGRVEYLEGAKA